jgi:hypothetical protein
MTTNPDREREDRVVAHLRAHGLLGAEANRERRTPQRWRAPVIAAAAVLVLAVLSVIADRRFKPAPPSEPAVTPTLLVWY